MKTRQKYDLKRVKELVSIGEPDLRKTFKDVVLTACDKVCGKKSRRDEGDMWWWNEDVKDTMARQHFKSCAGSHQTKIRFNTNVQEIKREKLLLEL